jgi:glycosyltransferase involved in cell wall biosynthesis
MAKNLGIKIFGPAQSINAWGLYTREIALALYDIGINVNLVDTTQQGDFQTKTSIMERGKLALLLQNQNNPLDKNYVAIQINSPEKISFTDNDAIANIAWTGVDVDDVPMISAMMLSNPAIKQVWVPGSWQKDVFDRIPAIKQKTKIVNFGVNNKKMSTAKASMKLEKDTFYFSHVGSLKEQNATDAVLKAFYSEFKDDDNVKLILKLFHGNIDKKQEKELMEKFTNQFKNGSKAKVLYVSGIYPENSINEIIASSNCYISTARGKHWNNSVLKAMAANRPVIVNLLAGNRQYCSGENSFQVSSKKIQINSMQWLMQNALYQGSSWFEPNPEELKKVMRNVYNLSKENPEELSKLAERGRNKALKLDWKNIAVEVLKNIKQYEVQ